MRKLLVLLCLFTITARAQQADTVISSDDIYRFITEVVMKDSIMKERLYLRDEPSMNIMMYELEKSIADTTDGYFVSRDSVIMDTMIYTLNGKVDTSYLYLPASFGINMVQRNFSAIKPADRKFMLKQGNTGNGFIWDKKRLNAATRKTKYYYAISIPLFSYNKNQVLVSISTMCSGLCGSGAVYLYTHSNDGWERSMVTSWIH